MKITIVGGGMVGLAQAVALSALPVEITVIEAREPILEWTVQDYDARTCAINPKTQQFLQSINTWSKLQDVAIMEKMQVWDANGDGELDLSCTQLKRNRLASIVENRALVKVLWQQAQACDNITLQCPAKPDAAVFTADLVIGADGGHSWLREQLGMPFTEKDYEQQAIVAVIECEKPHQNTAYQVFHHSGPLALLPMTNPKYCAIVWSNELPRAEALMAMDQKLFNLELTNAFDSRLGLLKCLNAPKAIPLMLRDTKQYVKNNAVLIGDAAHSIHPLAGQGVNLGLMDVQCLTEKVKLILNDQKPQRHLRAYERERKFHNRNMMHAMSLVNILFAQDNAALSALRNMGLSLATVVQGRI